jgi:hypothetical protein
MWLELHRNSSAGYNEILWHLQYSFLGRRVHHCARNGGDASTQPDQGDVSEKNGTSLDNTTTAQADVPDVESGRPDDDGDVEMAQPSSTQDQTQLNHGDVPMVQSFITQDQARLKDGDAPMTQPPLSENQNQFDNGDTSMAQPLSAQDQPQPKGAEQTKTAEEVPQPPKDSRKKRELPVTLSRVLFHACDVCIYCGGKFVG